MSAILAFAAMLAPANPVPMVSHVFVDRARDRWMLAVLATGAVWLLLMREYWLAGIAVWYLLKWRSIWLPGTDELISRHLLTWIAIGGTWGMLRQIPAWAFDWIPYGWMAIATANVALSVYLARMYGDPYARKKLSPRGRGFLGSPVITAMFLALVAPFAPWWFWPVLAVGFYMTCSGLAILAVLVEFAVLYPWTIPYSLGLCALVGLTLWKSPRIKGERMWEWTPRGDSLDSVTMRLKAWWYLLCGWWHGPRWLGRGPLSAEMYMRKLASIRHEDLPSGESHAEAAQHLYEYGLVGLSGVLLSGWSFVGSVHLGDPWTAALVGGLVLSLMHWPFRHAALGVVYLTICAGVLR